MTQKEGQLNEKLSFNIVFIGIFIIFTFLCNNEYLGITEYYYLPIISILFSIIGFIKKPMKIKVEHWCSFFIIVYIIAGIAINDVRLEKGIILSYIVFILLFLLTTLNRINKREIQFLINSYIISAVIMSMIIIVFRNEFNGWVGTYRYTLKFNNETYVDPNFMGAFLVTPAIFSLNKIIRKKTKLSFYINCIIFLLISMAVFLTGSRAALISLIGSIVLILIYYKNIKVLIISFISISFISLVLLKTLPEGTIERMFFNSYVDGSNITRLRNWIHGIEAFSYKPFWGYGCIDTDSILISVFGYSHAIHNTYIAFLAQFGIFGFIPIVVILIKAILYSFRRGYRLLIPIIFQLIFTSTMIEENTSVIFWIVLIIIYTIINYKINNPNQKIEDIIY